MELKNSREIPIGGKITEAGNAEEYNTGDWRTFKPIIDQSKCTNCLFCWMYCPDSSILIKDAKVTGVDYKHCKGCGICAEVCPRKCIKMEKG
ncbi:MAG: 4Fe-4S binding protein [Elusimicrobia bacterium]|nr:4Fe-4S binding protein [Elusimicrobiota bacterium]